MLEPSFLSGSALSQWGDDSGDQSGGEHEVTQTGGHFQGVWLHTPSRVLASGDSAGSKVLKPT